MGVIEHNNGRRKCTKGGSEGDLKAVVVAPECVYHKGESEWWCKASYTSSSVEFR